jgi:predicted phosphodiesterase
MSTKYQTFQTSTTDIKAPYAHTVKIKPFGDIHRDSHNCDVKRWKEWLKEAKETHDEYTYYVGLGDYNDFASYTERKQIRDLHESTCEKLDKVAAADVAKFCDEISFMKGQLLGFVHGNHEWIFLDGKLATEKMCEIMDCPFLGYAAYVRLRCKIHSNSYINTDLFMCHGKGAGRLLGSTINSIEKAANIFHDADIYLMGHDHKRGAMPKTVLDMNSKMEVREKLQWFGRTGSFLRGFVEDTPSYVVGAMYPPTSLGTISFEIEHSRQRENGRDFFTKNIRCHA